MTGIERLRKLSEDMLNLSLWVLLTTGTEKDWDCRQGDGRTVNDELLSIADQIERERACDADAIENVRLIVGGVIDDMERHVSGVESMEDSPVARWARELRRALGGHVEEITDVATIRKDAYDAYEWVREHGGLDAMVELSSRLMTVDALRAAIEETCTRIGVEHTGDLTQDAQAIWREIGALRSRLKESVPRAAYERHLARRQRQIDESHAALRRRNHRIEELGHRVSDLTNENAELRKRAMPEGFEWPTVDGRKVDFKTPYQPSLGVLEAVSIYSNGACEVMSHDGIIKDVKEIHVATPKVLDADGVDTSVGDTVYDVDTGEKMWVCALPEQGAYRCVKLRLSNGMSTALDPCRFTHRAPVLAADGEPLEVGQTVYGTRDLEPVEIVSLRSKEYDGVRTVKCKDRTGFVFYAPNDLIHHRPVLDADGVPIELGDDLYSVEGSLKLHVSNIDRANCRIATSAMFALDKWADPSMFTHTKPEIDTWQRIEEDARLKPLGYVDRVLGWDMSKSHGQNQARSAMTHDLVRRCRALAERERGEA